MSDITGFILGFDPGGTGNFGWSICQEVGGTLQPPATIGLANDAWDAITQVREALPTNPTVLAAGIDAPLFWSKRGNRRVDDILRKALRDTPPPAPRFDRKVLSVNGLWGAVLVQGVLVGRHLHEQWRDLKLTESHPTAFRYLLQHSGQPARIVGMAEDLIACLDDDARDATLCAVAAWAMRHHHDLCGWQDLFAQECCPVQLFDPPASYWMPIPPASTAS